MTEADIVEHASPFAFDATVERLRRVLTEHGMTIFAVFDHAANAREAGLSMPPTTVLVYGNPKGGTPIMLQTPQMALDLPLRVLVREGTDGVTVIGFRPVPGLEAAGRLLMAALTP
jgi:uncharacterized protein (DUF302 family)